MAAISSAARSFSLLLLRPTPSPPLRRRLSVAVTSLLSGVDNGGEFISTRKSLSGPREFAVIKDMLRRIEPLDGSVISVGVSVPAKESMKQTISSMLGLLPSRQFDVCVRVSETPLHRLLMSSIITGLVYVCKIPVTGPLNQVLMSSIITGYTLWNAEYRISLMRNFNIPTENWKRQGDEQSSEVSEEKREKSEGESGGDNVDSCLNGVENLSLQSLENLSPEAQSYIQELELELSTAIKELDAKKQDNLQMECNRESHNDLLDYLRSLDADMVNELSRPSSIEVEEITHHLVENILKKFFEDESSCEFNGDFAAMNSGNVQSGDEKSPNSVCASRDYLAKLLFWCMLLGHHLRGLENRLHLSCVVGLL